MGLSPGRVQLFAHPRKVHTMPRYEKDGRAYETSSTREGTRLKALGYKEVKARTKEVREADEKRDR